MTEVKIPFQFYKNTHSHESTAWVPPRALEPACNKWGKGLKLTLPHGKSPLNAITSNLLQTVHIRHKGLHNKIKAFVMHSLDPGRVIILTNLTVHPLQSPSFSRKFHSPIGLLSK